MRMLNALPESVKGCLLEAARLCGPAAPLAQRNLLAQWSSQAHPLNTKEPSIQGLSKQTSTIIKRLQWAHGMFLCSCRACNGQSHHRVG